MPILIPFDLENNVCCWVKCYVRMAKIIDFALILAIFEKKLVDNLVCFLKTAIFAPA